MGKVYTNGVMVNDTKENSRKGRRVERVSLHGLMVTNTQENMLEGKCMEEVHS